METIPVPSVVRQLKDMKGFHLEVGRRGLVFQRCCGQGMIQIKSYRDRTKRKKYEDAWHCEICKETTMDPGFGAIRLS